MKKGLIFFLFFSTFISYFEKSDAITNRSEESLGCNNENSKNYYLNFTNKKIKKIEIDTHNYKSWTVNNIKIITSNSRFISNNLKKKFDSTIKVTYEDNFFCILILFGGSEMRYVDSK